MVLDSSSSSISPLPSPSPHMCRSRKDALASDPKPRSPTTPFSPQIRYSSTTTNSTSFPGPSNVTGTGTASSSGADAAHSSTSSATSLASLRLSLPQKPTLYPFSEISAATNNFLSKRLSSTSSSSWRCTLRSKDVVVFQRSFRGGDPSSLPSRLSSLCKSHHSSLIKLLGASLSGDDHIYLVYEYVVGASLQDCLRNPRNPNFTPLSKWLSRMQVATDLADGLDYIHSQCRTIHNRIKSSSVIVTEPKFNAKICHFGAANLAGEVPDVEDEKKIAEEGKGGEEEDDEILVEVTSSSPGVRRSGSRPMRIEGTRGYIAPEVIAGGEISYKSDVYALGVVILELISGREPLKYTMNRQTNDYERTSLIETAREVIGTEDEDGASEAEAEADERRGKIRRWVDRRLRDSFPVEVAEKLIRVALRCVEEAAFMRPDTRWIAGKVSRLFLDSQAWEARVAVPTDFSVSLAPR